MFLVKDVEEYACCVFKADSQKKACFSFYPKSLAFMIEEQHQYKHVDPIKRVE